MNHVSKATIATLAALSLFCGAGAGLAQAGPSQDGQGAGPPAEAFAACSGKSDGDKVTFATPQGQTVSGVCREHQGKIFAVPENGPQANGQGQGRQGEQGDRQMSGQRRGQGGPPPEAIAACSGKSDGDAVSFETPRGETVSGTCRQIDNQLVAVPEHGRRGMGPGNHNGGQQGQPGQGQ